MKALLKPKGLCIDFASVQRTMRLHSPPLRHAYDPNSRYSARVIADSEFEGRRLTSVLCTYPLLAHVDLLRHRVFSRSVASNRAIPVKRMILNATYCPELFGSAQAGMSGGEPLTGWRGFGAQLVWRAHGACSKLSALAMAKLGVHKEHANRLLQPHVWVTELISGTEWQNFFDLRIHAAAQPEARTIAELILEAREGSKPKILKQGEWHLPFAPTVEEIALVTTQLNAEKQEPVMWTERRFIAAKISTGRCARLSYEQHNGVREPLADYKLFKRLAESRHLSPSEHVAQADMLLARSGSGNFRGPFRQFRDFVENGSAS